MAKGAHSRIKFRPAASPNIARRFDNAIGQRGVCGCGKRLLAANGDPAAAEPGRYAAHTELSCGSCGRTYAYIPDAETLEERSGPRQGAPA